MNLNVFEINRELQKANAEYGQSMEALRAAQRARQAAEDEVRKAERACSVSRKRHRQLLQQALKLQPGGVR